VDKDILTEKLLRRLRPVMNEEPRLRQRWQAHLNSTPRRLPKPISTSWR